MLLATHFEQLSCRHPFQSSPHVAHLPLAFFNNVSQTKSGMFYFSMLLKIKEVRCHNSMWRVTVLCAGIGLSVLSVPAAKAQGQPAPLTQPEIVSVNNPRPLARALARIEELYHSPIDYEEVPYESPSDLASTSVTRNGVNAQRVFPRGGQLTVTLSPETDPTPYLAVESVLGEYINAGLAGQYRVDQLHDRIEVVPTRVSTSGGSQRDISPVMSTPISFPSANRPIAVTLNILASKLSAMAGVKVLMAGEPFQDNATVELGADNEPARNLIVDLGTKTGVPLSFALLYDPNEKAYYLDIKSVPTGIKAGTARPANGPSALPKVGQSNSPFFVKTK
jgi:hypothetical protein